MSNKDLEVRLRLTATDKNVAGTVRNTRKEVQGLTSSLGGVNTASRGTAAGMGAITTAGDEATRMFKLQKGSLQQAGYQFQDLAVQIGSGTSAFVAIGQQGSQLLSLLGPGGALLGAVLAVGSVLGGAFFSGANKAAEGAETLKDRIKELELGYKDLTSAQRAYLGLRAAEDQKAFEDQIADAEKRAQKLRETISIFENGGLQINSTGPDAGGGIFGVENAISSVSAEEYLKAQEGLIAVNAELSTLKQESQAAEKEYNDLVYGFGQGEESAADAKQQVEEMVKALKAQADAIGETNRQTDLRIAKELKATDAQREAINAAYDAIEKEEALQESRKKAAEAAREAERAQRDFENSVSSLIDQLDPLGAEFASVYEKQQLLIRASQEGLISDDQRDKLITNLVEGLADAGDEYDQWIKSLKDGIDPLQKAEKEIAKIWSAFEAGDLGNIDRSQVQDYVDSLREGALGVNDAWTDAGKAMDNFAGSTANSLRTMQGLFKEGDAGYKSLTVGIQALNTLQAVNAVLNQSAGDPYTAFGRMAAMAASVASLGYAVGSLNGSGGDPTADRQENQSTGTVLGSANAKTESIANATDIIAETNQELVNINTGMLKALQAVQVGIGNAAAMIARGSDAKVGSLSGNKSIGDVLDFMPIQGEITQFAVDFFDQAIELFTFGLVDGFIGDTLGSVFGGKQKIIDEGIRIVGGNLRDVINEVMVQSYAEIETDGGWFGSDDRDKEYQNLSEDVRRQFSLVYRSIYDSVSAGAEALGILPDEIQARLDEFVIATRHISLEDLDAEEQQAELEAYFSKVFDIMAGDIVPFIDLVQNAGEGLGETLARAATQVQVMEEAINTLGLTASKVAPVTQTLAADALADLFGGAEELATSLTGFESNFFSDAEQFEINSRRLSQAMGDLPLAATREGYIALIRAQNIYTEEGRANLATLLKLQDAADEYYDYLEAGTESAFEALQSSVGNAISDLESQLATLKQAVSAAVEGSDTAYGELARIVNEQKKAEQDRLQAQLDANRRAQQTIRDITGDISQEVDRISRTLKGLVGDLLGPELSRLQALETLRGALATGDLTGTGEAAGVAAQIDASQFATATDFARQQGQTAALLSEVAALGQDQLSDAERQIQALNRQSEMMQTISEDEIERLDGILEKAQGQIDELRGTGDKVTTIEEALGLLRESLEEEAEAREDLENSTHQEQIDHLRAMLEEEQKQYNALMGIDTSILSVADALGAWRDEVARQNEKLAERAKDQEEKGEFIPAWQNYLAANQDVKNVYEGRIPDGARFDASDVQKVIRDNGIDSAQAFAEWHWQNYGRKEGRSGWEASVPQFASGGLHMGGVRVVGERGPELEFTGPSRIYSNAQSRSLLDLGPVVNALRQVEARLSTVEAYARQTTKNTGQSAKYSKRWDIDGLPPTREVVTP